MSDIDKMKEYKEALLKKVGEQMNDLDRVCTPELGDVVDMIKDLSEAIHYCTITDAMEESKNRSGYSQMDPATFMSRQDMRSYNSYPNHMRPFDPMYGEETKMYYGGRESPTTDWRDNRRGYDQNNMNRTGRYYDDHMEDYRDGRSHISRRGYMEAKDTGMDAESKMRRLKKYLGDLGFDISEMIADGTSEEKSAIREKLNNIQQML